MSVESLALLRHNQSKPKRRPATATPPTVPATIATTDERWVVIKVDADVVEEALGETALNEVTILDRMLEESADVVAIGIKIDVRISVVIQTVELGDEVGMVVEDSRLVLFRLTSEVVRLWLL